jgi:hypothetical protein
MAFDLSNYETVEERLVRWWAAYPDGQIVTTMVHYDGKTVVFRAEGIVAGHTIATGFAEEVHGSSPVNKTSFVENCETSAIGRMIGNSPLGTKPGARPSRQEMQKVERSGFPPAPEAHGGLATPKQLNYIKKLAKDRGMDDEQVFDELRERYGSEAGLLETLTTRQASQIIEAWK